MPVTFPSGIVCELTATRSISLACASICCGSSNTIPSGAASIFVGCAEWHGTQRACTIDCARAKGTAAVPAGSEPDPPSSGRIATATTAIPSAAVTGIHQTVRPAWRRLKKCRIQAPIDIRATRTSHDQLCPYVAGKWLLSIANTTGSVR
jgi:hypothetical protein